MINCALMAVINLLSGTHDQTTAVLQYNFVETFCHMLMTRRDSKIQKNICFAISNIAAGNADHMLALTNSDVYKKLVDMFGSSRRAVQIEIIHVLHNTIFNPFLCDDFSDDFINVFFKALTFEEEDTVVIIMILESLTCCRESVTFIPSTGETTIIIYYLLKFTLNAWLL